jgi:hypothetical protein
MVRSCGPGVRSVAVKSGIGFMVRVRFAGVRFRRDGIVCTFWLKRRIRSARLRRAEHLERSDWIYEVLVTSPDQLDRELLGWIREAYAVGRQEWSPDRPRSGRRR